MRIAVIGAGYVGLSNALNLTELRHEVHCCEIDPERFAALAEGRPALREPGVREALQTALQEGILQLHSDIASASREAALLCIAVTLTEADETLWQIVQEASATLLPGAVIVVKSTVPPGTCARLTQRIEQLDKTLYVACCPEFLRQGHALEDCRRPSRIVIGAEEEVARQHLHDVYAPLLKRNRAVGQESPMLFCRTASAELSKLASNLLLAARISVINEVAALCDAVTGDIDEVSKIAGMDARIGPDYLQAGPGFGGSCLPKDGRILSEASREAGLDATAIEAIVNSNERRIEQLPRSLCQLRDEVGADGPVAVWGLSFKAGTDDLRHSPALLVVRALAEAGLSVRVCDPTAQNSALPLGVVRYDDAIVAARGADMLLVLNANPEFTTIELRALSEAMAPPRVVYDAVRLFDEAAMCAAGLDYRALGRG